MICRSGLFHERARDGCTHEIYLHSHMCAKTPADSLGTVLPAIGALWTAAANATKAGNMSMPEFEQQCSQMSCATGRSGNTTGAVVMRQ